MPPFLLVPDEANALIGEMTELVAHEW